MPLPWPASWRGTTTGPGPSGRGTHGGGMPKPVEEPEKIPATPAGDFPKCVNTSYSYFHGTETCS